MGLDEIWMIGHCHSNSMFIVMDAILHFSNVIVVSFRQYVKKYDDISIYSMHTAAVGVLSKVELSGFIRCIRMGSKT